MLTHEECMRAALQMAEEAYGAGETPVGAVLAHNGEIIARAGNRRETDIDPTAHAEILVLREGARVLGTRRLNECTLYVTLEPCPMCAGAMVMALLGGCYFGARDPRQGCVESVYALPQDSAFYHRVPCVGGLLEAEAGQLLRRFFRERRSPLTKDA